MKQATGQEGKGADWGRNDGSSAYLWILALVASFAVADGALRLFEMPVALRALFALVPVLPFVFLARAHWRMVTRGDEMARHLARETYVFAFYGLLAVFMCVDLLKAGGVLPDFAWRTKSLLWAMIGTLAAATGWTRWRYR